MQLSMPVDEKDLVLFGDEGSVGVWFGSERVLARGTREFFWVPDK